MDNSKELKYYIQIINNQKNLLSLIEYNSLRICDAHFPIKCAKDKKSNNIQMRLNTVSYLRCLDNLLLNGTSYNQLKFRLDMKNIYCNNQTLISEKITFHGNYLLSDIVLNGTVDRCATMLLYYNLLIIPICWSDGYTYIFKGVVGEIFYGPNYFSGKFKLDKSFSVTYFTYKSNIQSLKNLTLKCLIKNKFKFLYDFIAIPVETEIK